MTRAYLSIRSIRAADRTIYSREIRFDGGRFMDSRDQQGSMIPLHHARMPAVAADRAVEHACNLRAIRHIHTGLYIIPRKNIILVIIYNAS